MDRKPDRRGVAAQRLGLRVPLLRSRPDLDPMYLDRRAAPRRRLAVSNWLPRHAR
jgi:hypothetical protein